MKFASRVTGGHTKFNDAKSRFLHQLHFIDEHSLNQQWDYGYQYLYICYIKLNIGTQPKASRENYSP